MIEVHDTKKHCVYSASSELYRSYYDFIWKSLGTSLFCCCLFQQLVCLKHLYEININLCTLPLWGLSKYWQSNRVESNMMLLLQVRGTDVIVGVER